jgi:hypothetical protein
MKILYVGVSYSSHLCLDDGSDDSQIIKNDTKPAEQLCAETDLSSFSRFTKNRCVIGTRRKPN